MHFRTAISILVVGMFATASALGSGSKPTLKSVGDGLICLCGVCNMTLNSCNHYLCSSRTEMQALIQKEIAGGKDETTILQDFVLRYGVKVLSTPPARGFNLTVWVLPGVGLIAGLVVLIAITKRWRKPSTQARKAAPVSVDPKLLAAVEEEMKTSGLRIRD